MGKARRGAELGPSVRRSRERLLQPAHAFAKPSPYPPKWEEPGRELQRCPGFDQEKARERRRSGALGDVADLAGPGRPTDAGATRSGARSVHSRAPHRGCSRIGYRRNDDALANSGWVSDRVRGAHRLAGSAPARKTALVPARPALRVARCVLSGREREAAARDPLLAVSGLRAARLGAAAQVHRRQSRQPRGMLRPDGNPTPGSPFAAGGSLWAPRGPAVDGNDQVWISDLVALGISSTFLPHRATSGDS